MKVTLLNVTPNAENHIVEVARVSSSRKNKKDKPDGLLPIPGTTQTLVAVRAWACDLRD